METVSGLVSRGREETIRDRRCHLRDNLRKSQVANSPLSQPSQVANSLRSQPYKAVTYFVYCMYMYPEHLHCLAYHS